MIASHRENRRKRCPSIVQGWFFALVISLCMLVALELLKPFDTATTKGLIVCLMTIISMSLIALGILCLARDLGPTCSTYCTHCGYDLRAHACFHACPECGRYWTRWKQPLGGAWFVKTLIGTTFILVGLGGVCLSTVAALIVFTWSGGL